MPNWILYAFLSMIFAGITSVVIKFGLKDIPSDLAMIIRTIVILILVVLNFMVWHPVSTVKQVTVKTLLFLVFSGITTTLSWIFYYRALKEGNVSVVATIDKGSIIITLLLSFLILKEPFTWRIALAALLITSGLVLLTWK